MYFSAIFTSTLLAAASAAAVPGQQQTSGLAARQFNGGKCTINLEQFKKSEERPAYFTGESLDGNGEKIGYFELDFLGGGYPQVMRGFPEFLLISREDKQDVPDESPIHFQYECQKWTSDADQCETSEFEGESRNISCTFEC